MTAGDLWASFGHDPRRAEHAGLRASDTDRELVHQVLTEAYADGRLDREEFDSRTEQVAAARTLGELPALVDDLVPTTGVPAVPYAAGAMTPAQLHDAAVAKWAGDRRSAVGGFITASLICWAIWAATMFGDFPWPIFVMLGTGINAANVLFQRHELIEKERARLEKRQRKALQQKQPPPEENPT